ncbi:hypothetical protein OIDMADRAFT_169650 [Oidiodendron maius Zn]|uniref:Beta-lactamase-related domain-containing protein n=1 Tax=Oidiodendron maius (strain Zn) TaxID=913774 RepID=A0A0C3H2V3_OIDMZ|nr:hypothetical protein OIDMADRAFT_169650 [Oidiodendron maius Zn]
MALGRRIQALLDESTSDPIHGIPGAVFVAVDRTGAQIAANASGVRGLNEKAPMTLDAVFYIASCTKLIVAIAALQLVEQGKLSLDDAKQIKEYLPELSETRVINSEGKIGDVRKNDITLRMLLSHTAGYGYQFFNTTLRDTGYSFPMTLKELLGSPVLFEPGTSWEYSISFDIAGVLIERATGKTLETYVRQYIFEPLGITDFSFYVPQEKRLRLVGWHYRGGDASLSEGPCTVPVVTEGEAEIVQMGGSGGFATMIEYSKILATILAGGASPTTHQRILGENTVKLLLQNLMPDMPDIGRKGLQDAIPILSNVVPELYPQPGNPPQGWSMAGMVTLEADSTTGRIGNTVHWCGLLNLYWWLDSASGISGILATQILPFWDDRVHKLREQVEKAVYDSLI